MGPEWDPVTRAVEAGTEADVPVMIDFGGNDPPLSLDELLNKRLRPGDILTHTYAHVRGRQPIVNDQGQVEPYRAGGPQARRALRRRSWRRQLPVAPGGAGHEAGLLPRRDQHGPAHRQPERRHEGHPQRDVEDAGPGHAAEGRHSRQHARAAEVIKRADLGHLGVGTEADVAVLAVRQGEFGFIDSSGGRMAGTQKLECEVTVRAGQVVWDLNGRAAPAWTEMPATPQGEDRAPNRERTAGADTPPGHRPAAAADRASSPGVLVGKTLYISGSSDFRATAAARRLTAQTRQAMDGIGGVLKAAGLGYEHLVKCHVYLANMDDYAAMNAAYGSYFKERVPARTTIQAAALPSGAGVEIACIGYADLAGISVVRPPQGTLPAPLGPYSPAVWAGDTLYVSGMGGQDPASKTVGETVRGAGRADGGQHHDDAEGRRARPVRRGVGAGLRHPRRGERARCCTPPGEGRRGAARRGRGAAAAGADPGGTDVRGGEARVARPNFGVAGSHFTARVPTPAHRVRGRPRGVLAGTDVSADIARGVHEAGVTCSNERRRLDGRRHRHDLSQRHRRPAARRRRVRRSASPLTRQRAW